MGRAISLIVTAILLLLTSAAPADTIAAAQQADAAPGQIIIKPTGRKRVSRVGQAPPPPDVDYRRLAQGDSPKGGGPWIHYPIGYRPIYYYSDYCHGYGYADDYGCP
jgi:hypothetical protein